MLWWPCRLAQRKSLEASWVPSVAKTRAQVGCLRLSCSSAECCPSPSGLRRVPSSAWARLGGWVPSWLRAKSQIGWVDRIAECRVLRVSRARDWLLECQVLLSGGRLVGKVECSRVEAEYSGSNAKSKWLSLNGKLSRPVFDIVFLKQIHSLQRCFEVTTDVDFLWYNGRPWSQTLSQEEPPSGAHNREKETRRNEGGWTACFYVCHFCPRSQPPYIGTSTLGSIKWLNKSHLLFLSAKLEMLAADH